MTTDHKEILQMAREAGLTGYGGSQQSNGLHSWHAYTDQLEHFAALVRKAEQERCAKVCDAWESAWRAAVAIRAVED